MEFNKVSILSRNAFSPNETQNWRNLYKSPASPMISSIQQQTKKVLQSPQN